MEVDRRVIDKCRGDRPSILRPPNLAGRLGGAVEGPAPRLSGSLGNFAQEDRMFSKILEKIKELLGGKPMADADLMAEMEKKAEGTGLNWKRSVVDFMKVLGIDSSRTNRDALATELGVSQEGTSGSASRNEALRVALFKKLAANGGNIPNSLLD
jgi:hypothetical protein